MKIWFISLSQFKKCMSKYNVYFWVYSPAPPNSNPIVAPTIELDECLKFYVHLAPWSSIFFIGILASGSRFTARFNTLLGCTTIAFLSRRRVTSRNGRQIAAVSGGYIGPFWEWNQKSHCFDTLLCILECNESIMWSLTEIDIIVHCQYYDVLND